MNIPPIEEVKAYSNERNENDDVENSILQKIRLMNARILYSSTLGSYDIRDNLLDEEYNHNLFQNYWIQLYNAGYCVKTFRFVDNTVILIRWNRPACLGLGIPNEEYDAEFLDEDD